MTPFDRQLILSLPNATPEEVVEAHATAASTALTVRAIDLAELEGYLLANKLYAVLVGASTNTGLSAELRGGIVTTFGMLQSTRLQTARTDEADKASAFAEVMAGLIDANLMTDAHRTAIYALGGGLRYSAITEDDVAAVRAQAAREALAAALDNWLGIKLYGPAHAAVEALRLGERETLTKAELREIAAGAED